MRGKEKSGLVSRGSPRSSASTCTPASVSPLAMTAPAQPNPTSTTSTGLRCGAISEPLPGDADRPQRIWLVVPLGPFEVTGARAGEAYHLPAAHPVVAAMDGIGEIAFFYVLPKKTEEPVQPFLLRPEAVGGTGVEHLVLRVPIQLRERPAIATPALGVKGGAGPPIAFARRLARVVAESPRGSFPERPLHIPSRRVPEAAFELAVDELRHAQAHRAGAVIVLGNEPVACGVDELPFAGAEVSGLIVRGWRIGGGRLGRRFRAAAFGQGWRAGRGQGACGHQRNGALQEQAAWRVGM